LISKAGFTAREKAKLSRLLWKVTVTRLFGSPSHGLRDVSRTGRGSRLKRIARMTTSPEQALQNRLQKSG